MTPDVNVLVAAFRADHAHHRVARPWLNTALAATESGGVLQLLPMVVASFLRLVTHPKVFADPAPAELAVAFVDALLAVPGCEWLTLGEEWPQLAALCKARALAANDVPDAWIAAAVRRHGTVLVTFDRDFLNLLEPHQLTLLTAS
jgi:toxin-antitoxin system PIN domain toxin